jgi:alkyl hydroperoxide reductase subunit AhpC
MGCAIILSVEVALRFGRLSPRVATKNALPFTLLSDAEGEVHRRHGLASIFGILPGRVTYVIGTKVLNYILSSQTNPTKHVDEAVRVLRPIIEEGEVLGTLETWRSEWGLDDL